MKNLNRQTIQRMIDGRAGSSGGGSSRGADLAGYATEVWVNQNYVSIEFFNQLFNIHGHAADDTSASPTDISVLPNDTESIVDSIETMVGLWTEEYLSALGLNSQGGEGGASALSDLLDVSISSPQNGQVLTYNSATGKWVNATPASPGGVGTVTSVGVSVPTGFSVSNTPVTSSGTIAISFASGYSLPTDAKQSDWDDALTLATAISGNFDNVGNAKAANKLTTYSKTAWGQTYWTSGGVPDSISGNMSSVGDIAFSASGKNIGGLLYFNTTDSQIKVGANATKVSYTQVIGGTTYTYTPKLYIDQSIGVAGSVFSKQIELYGTSGESSSYIDFHYGGSTSDYTARIIESASGIVTISNAVNTAKLYLYKPNAGSDTGAVYLEYDSNNSGIHLVGGGLYADTYISALGANSQQGGGRGDVYWSQLTTGTGGQQISGTLLSAVTKPLYILLNDDPNPSITYDGKAYKTVGNIITKTYADGRYVRFRDLGTDDLTSISGSFFFGGAETLASGYDYTGFQVGNAYDRWQLVCLGDLFWRQNDSSEGSSTWSSGWNSWRTICDSSNTYINGQTITINGTSINVGSGSASDYVKYAGNQTSIGSESPFSGATAWATSTNIPNGNALVYNNSGTEFSMLFSFSPVNISTYGTILCWGYNDTYIWMARKYRGEWRSEDWEKISAGFADKIPSHTLWGQTFDGTGNVSGNMTGVGSISASDNISIAKNDGYFSITSPNANESYLFGASDSGYIYGTVNGRYITFRNGLVGVKTNNPAYTLHVNGTLCADGIYKSNSSDSYVLLGGGGHSLISDLSVNKAKILDNVITTEDAALLSAEGLGFFKCETSSTSSGDGQIIDVAWDANWHTQLFVDAGNTHKLYIRNRSYGTFNDWKYIVTQANIGSQSVNYATSAGNADTVDNYHANGLFTTLLNSSTSGHTNDIEIGIGGTTKYLTVGYATSANTAAKLSTVSKTAWGRTYWTSEGVPDNISGQLDNVTNIFASGCVFINGYDKYFEVTNSQAEERYLFGSTTTGYIWGSVNGTYLRFKGGNVGVSEESPSYKLHVNGYTKTTRLYLSDSIYLEVANNGVHIVGGGLYADTYVSAFGANTSSGGGVGDVTWSALATAVSSTTQQIDASHITNALSTCVRTTGNQTITGIKTLYNAIVTSNFGAKFESICIACGTDGFVGTHFGEINRFSGTLHLQYDTDQPVSMCQNVLVFSNTTVNTVSVGAMGTNSNRGLYFYTSGSAPIYGSQAWSNVSDIRRKDIVTHVNGNVEDIANAPVFDFTWKGDTSLRVMLGTSAQYWQNIFPHAITDFGGTLTMDYGATALAAAVITARRVQNHEDRIRDLENENRKLREEIRLLKTA